MTDCESEKSVQLIQRADCVDGETVRLLTAFYGISDGAVRQKVIDLVREIQYDEDAAEEILSLAEAALRRPDQVEEY